MKAVNLIPADSKRGGPGSASSLPNAPAIGLLALLTVALAFVTIYVLTSNTMSSRKAKIASTQLQLTAAQAQVARLTNYTQLAQLAVTRIQTIRQIATTRFDWYAALGDLSRVVPADTSLQSLVGTVSPNASAGAGVGSTSTGGGSAIRGDVQAPAIELSGCTKTQTDVARLMSRLRLVNGVTRVTLAQSQKQQTAQSGVAASPGGASAQGCGVNAPTFDLVVFFQPLPGAASSTTATAGTASTAAGTATTTTAPTASTATTTPAPSTTTTTQSATSSGAGSGGAQ